MHETADFSSTQKRETIELRRKSPPNPPRKLGAILGIVGAVAGAFGGYHDHSAPSLHCHRGYFWCFVLSEENHSPILDF